jgi:hypothetical protein
MPTQLPEKVFISVERMMRYCYLVELTFECAGHKSKVLPLHVTRFGTLVLESASFLYSLFDDRSDSTNLLKIWTGFEHPFQGDLQQFVKTLQSFKADLRLVTGVLTGLTRSKVWGSSM